MMAAMLRQDPSPSDGLRFHHATRSALGRISGAGWMTHGGMKDWRDLGHHAAAFIMAGEGRYQDESGRDEAVGPGTLIVVFPGLKHCYHPNAGYQVDGILPDLRWSRH